MNSRLSGSPHTDSSDVDGEVIYATIDNDISPELVRRTPDIVNSCSVAETSYSAASYREAKQPQNGSHHQTNSPYTGIYHKANQPQNVLYRQANQTPNHNESVTDPYSVTLPVSSNSYGGYQGSHPFSHIQTSSGPVHRGHTQLHHNVSGQSSNYSTDSGISMAKSNSGSTYSPPRPDYLEVLPDKNTERMYRDHIENAQNPHNFINHTYQHKPTSYKVTQPGGGESWSWHNVTPQAQKQIH